MIVKHEYITTDSDGKKTQHVDDITQLISRIEWSGSRLQAARRLAFDVVQDYRDPNLPNHRYGIWVR